MKKKIMFLAMMLVMCFTFLPAVVHAGMPSVNIHEQTGLPIAVTGDEFEKGCYIVADSDNPVWCVYDRRNNILFLTKLDKTYELAEIRSELYGDKETRGFKKLTEQCSIETLLKEIVAVPSY